MTNTENKTAARIEENLDRITDLLKVLLRGNFSGWEYKFVTQEDGAPYWVLQKKNDNKTSFVLDLEGIAKEAGGEGWPNGRIRLTALEFALVRGRWCSLKAVQIEALANFVEKVLWLIAD